MKIWRGI